MILVADELRNLRILQLGSNRGLLLKVIVLISSFSFKFCLPFLDCIWNDVAFQVVMERLSSSLTLHLFAVLVSSGEDLAHLSYLLHGVWLLHSLCDLASLHTSLEQVILTLFCILLPKAILT
jgi:hypothetical protein